MSSFIPFIWNAPSPTIATTARSGNANFAAIAYGVPGPIVARLPERDAFIPLRSLRSPANQVVDQPESAQTIAPSGTPSESSQRTRDGAIGSISSWDVSASLRHQSATF